MGSETTAAAIGLAAGVRRDPFAMLPFMGYHVGNYLQHWLDIGASADASKLPRIYFVNWFRKDESGSFIWPGFGDNSRVLKWIVERINGTGKAVQSPIGNLPAPGAIDTEGLGISQCQMDEIFSVDKASWLSEIESIRENYVIYGDKLPAQLPEQLVALEKRLG